MIRIPFPRTLLLIAALTLIAGCNDGMKLQQDVQAALARHPEMNNYRFSGQAELNLRPGDRVEAADPLTARLFSMLGRGSVSWEGTASTDPARMELILRYTPQGETETGEIPILLQDNKMYVHIPAINETDEYYMIDLKRLGEMSDRANAATPDQLGSAGQLFSTVFYDIVSAFDAKRFREENGPEGERTIVIALAPRQFAEAVDAWFAAGPSIVDQLELAGYVAPDIAGQWRLKFGEDERRRVMNNTNRYRFDKPFRLSVNIDDAGFIRETRLDLAFSAMNRDGQSEQRSVYMVNRYDNINENLPFVMPIPGNIISFADILNLLGIHQSE